MKTLRFFTLFVLALFSFLLAGCVVLTPKTPTPTVIVSEPSETSAPPPTATAVIPPTATALPTAIPATATPNATEQAQADILAKAAPCDTASPNITYSPYQDWIVVTCPDENQDGLTTKFIKADGTKQWNISFNDLYIKRYKADDANLSTLLKQSFTPVYWTIREDYVYLAAPSAEEKAPYKGYDGLFRLDLASGKLTPTLDAATAPYTTSYTFKFSAGTKLASINQSVQTVRIVMDDTSTGDSQSITLDARFTQAGGLLWPQDDEKRLIVSAFDANTTGGGYSLIVYNLETNKNEYIMQRTQNAYLPVDWLDEDTIYAQEYPTGKWVYINLVTKAVSEAPAP